jgi:hypothetical protein
MARGRPPKTAKPLASPDMGQADGECDDGRDLSDYPMRDRDNADKILGRKALVQLGHQYGMLTCQMMAMPMEKMRQQIKFAQTSKITDEWLDLQEGVV